MMKDRIREFYRRSPLFLLMSILLSFGLHAPFMNHPPESTHVWRQTTTLAMARNFANEEMNVMHPRVDRRMNTPGITGSQFPAYEFGLAVLYKAFGEHNYLHRYYSFCLYALGALGMFALAAFVLKSKMAGNAAAFAWLFSPELFYHGINAMPDTLAVSAQVWGFYLFLKWFDLMRTDAGAIKQTIYWLGSLVCVMLGGLSKIQFLVVGFPMAVYGIQHFKMLLRPSRILGTLFYGVSAVAIPLAWYAYAVHLIHTSGLMDIGLTFRPAQSFWTAFDTFQGNVISDTPELLLGFASYIFFIAGIYHFFKTKAWHCAWFWPIVAWASGLLAYHLIELGQMKLHTYYEIPHIPLLILVTAYGFLKLSDSLKYSWLIGLLLLQPALTALRIIPARWMQANNSLPNEFFNPVQLKNLQNAAPIDTQCIVGPDASATIYFYFLAKKGYGFDKVEDLFNPESEDKNTLQRYIRLGARYLYIHKPSPAGMDKLRENGLTLISQQGDFYVYAVDKYVLWR